LIFYSLCTNWGKSNKESKNNSNDEALNKAVLAPNISKPLPITKLMKRIYTLIVVIIITSALQAQVFEVNKSMIYSSIILTNGVDLLNQLYQDKNIEPYNTDSLALLSKEDVFGLDRTLMQPYDKKVDSFGTALTFASLASTAFWSMYDEPFHWDNFLVLSDILVTQITVAHWTKSLTLRGRPYIYFDETPDEKQRSKDAKMSFYSLHTSTAFATAYFTYYDQANTIKDNYVIATSYLLATSVGLSRILAGEHFLTDVLVGAVMGTGISFLKCHYWSADDFSISIDSRKLSLRVTF